MGFDEYLSSVAESISLPQFAAEEITEELRGHLEDATHDLQLAGMRREASEREAMRRLGPPELLTAAYQHEHRRARSAVFRRPRLWLASVAVMTALLGGVAVAGAHTQHSPAPLTSTSPVPPRH